MRYISLIVYSIAALAVVINTGCKKNESPRPNFSDSLAGTWELRHASAAMNPQVFTPAAGNGTILKFTATGYEKYESHQLVKDGQYTVVEDPTVESSVCLLFPIGQFTTRIEYDGDITGDKQFFDFINNRLVIVSGCYAYDAGYRLEYEKIAEAGTEIN